MNKKVKSVLMYTVINGAWLTSGYFGFFEGVGWCVNVFGFITILSLIMSLFSATVMALCNNVIKQNTTAARSAQIEFLENRSKFVLMPVWLDALVDLAVIIPLILTGHIFWAVTATICLILQLYFKISYIKLLKWVRQELSNTQYPDSDDSDETVGYSDEDIDGDGEGDDTLRRMGVIR